MYTICSLFTFFVIFCFLKLFQNVFMISFYFLCCLIRYNSAVVVLAFAPEVMVHLLHFYLLPSLWCYTTSQRAYKNLQECIFISATLTSVLLSCILFYIDITILLYYFSSEQLIIIYEDFNAVRRKASIAEMVTISSALNLHLV